MSTYIESVHKFVDDFTKNPKYVNLNNDLVYDDEIIGNIKESLPEIQKSTGWQYCGSNITEPILYNLILNSVNFCFWYGRHDIKGDAGSHVMANNLYDIFKNTFDVEVRDNNIYDGYEWHELAVIAIDKFGEYLIKNRYPLLNERLNILKDLVHQICYPQGIDWIKPVDDLTDFEEQISSFLCQFSSFAGDIFLKRAFLFYIMLYRTLGWYKEIMSSIPIPSDYHIPNILRSLGILEYNQELSNMVDNNKLIFQGDLMEYEIRASAIKVCNLIANQVPCSPADVDSYLFFNLRKQANNPHHLTITTDY